MRRTVVAAAATAITAGGVAACGEDNGAGEPGANMAAKPGKVVLHERGSGPMALLPGKFAVGQSAELELEMAQRQSVAGASADWSLDMSSRRSVADVGAQATIEETVEDLDVDVSRSEARAEIERMLMPLEDSTLVYRYAPNGRQVGGVTRKDGGSLPAAFEQVQAAFTAPTEPVGVGARWSVGVEVETDAVSIPMTVDYELTELDGSGYVIKLSGESPVEETVQGAELTGTISQSGEIRGDRRNPLAVSSTAESVVDFEVQGQSVDTTTTTKLSTR